MLGIFLIICLVISWLIELKIRRLLKEGHGQPLEITADAMTYTINSRAVMLRSFSKLVTLVGYVGCAWPYLFIQEIDTSTYLLGIALFGAGPLIAIVFSCFSDIKGAKGYIRISTDEIEYNRGKASTFNISEISHIMAQFCNVYQIHFNEKGRTPLHINLDGFHNREQISSLLKQLHDHCAEVSGKNKSLACRLNSWKLYMMFEKYGQAFCMIAVGLVLLYASYCCIDYDFFKTDYVARFNQLNVDPNQPENAWPYYVLAGANYEELQEELEHKIRNIRKPDQSELSSDEIASLQEWLDKNTSSWESLCRATSIPYCNATYKHISLLTSTTDQDDFSSPSDAGYGQIRCLYKNTCACHLAGLIELNWFDLFQMQLISSKHFTNGKTLIANFVGYGMLSSATKLLSQQDSYQLDDLRKARELLKEYFPANLPSLNIEGEILILCSSHDNMINMKKIPVQSPFNPLFLFFGSAGGTEKHLRKKFMTELDQAKKGIEVSQKSLGIADMFRPGRSFIGFFGGSFYKAYKISQRAHANLLAAYVLLDIEEYYLKERSYPENIPQLREAGFISQLPDDPDTDSTIIYRNDSQRAILYAVGPNSKDDGGYRDDKGCDEKRDDTIYWQRNLTETGK